MWPLHSRSRPLGHSFASESAWRPRVAVASDDAQAPGEGSRVVIAVSDADADADADADGVGTPATPLGAPPKKLDNEASARRRRWQRRLSSKAFHVLVLGLVLLDLCTIVVDLALVLAHSEYRPTEEVEHASKALAATSIAILSLFVLEFCCAAAVFGPRAWLSEPLHRFDVGVVAASLALEAALFHLDKEAGFEGLAALLVLGRLWRLARVAYTSTEATEAVLEVRAIGGGGGGGGGGPAREVRAIGGGGGGGGGGPAREVRAIGGGGGGGGGGPAREVSALRQEVAALKAQLAEAGLARRPWPGGGERGTVTREEDEGGREAAVAAAAAVGGRGHGAAAAERLEGEGQRGQRENRSREKVQHS